MYKEYFTPDKTQTMEDIHATIDLLYITQCRATKNALLNRLRRLLAQLTIVPYSNFNGNVVPAEVQYDLPSSDAMPQMQTGMPQGALVQPQSMPPSMPRNIQQPVKFPMAGYAQHTMTGSTGESQGGGNTQTVPMPQPRVKTENLRTFTIDELSRYDGKGDNPAYVSVNGMVYDITDQPGWAAGSHFGLKAGLDQTSAYISCHTGQPMIDRLKVIGRLVK
ncbi:MAG: hypothetical protein WCP73_01255 [Eubacteriales bacterium]